MCTQIYKCWHESHKALFRKGKTWCHVFILLITQGNSTGKKSAKASDHASKTEAQRRKKALDAGSCRRSSLASKQPAANRLGAEGKEDVGW